VIRYKDNISQLKSSKGRFIVILDIIMYSFVFIACIQLAVKTALGRLYAQGFLPVVTSILRSVALKEIER
jgi:hypothetical protein